MGFGMGSTDPRRYVPQVLHSLCPDAVLPNVVDLFDASELVPNEDSALSVKPVTKNPEILFVNEGCRENLKILGFSTYYWS